MKPLFAHSIKTGVMALGLVFGLAGSTFAGPMPQLAPSVPSSMAASDIIPIRDGWAGGNSRADYWRHNRHNRHWNGNRWRHHNTHRRYYNDRRWRGHRRHYGGSGFYLGLGGLAIGPAIRYYEPRRVYRGSNAHVRWCYNRYRSYRASDNTFQPYHGPRQQCYSPYR
jgi:hypothetical protein